MNFLKTVMFLDSFDRANRESRKNDDLLLIIENALNYVEYLQNHCKYNLNSGHLRKLKKILKAE